MVLHTPSLGELVDFTANESSKEFLGEGVVHDVACYNVRSKEATKTASGEERVLTLLALVVFVELEALKSSTASYELMGELGLMVWVVVASALVVNLVVSVLRIT